MYEDMIEKLKEIEFCQREGVIFSKKDEMQIKLLCHIIIDNFELNN